MWLVKQNTTRARRGRQDRFEQMAQPSSELSNRFKSRKIVIRNDLADCCLRLRLHPGVKNPGVFRMPFKITENILHRRLPGPYDLTQFSPVVPQYRKAQ